MLRTPGNQCNRNVTLSSLLHIGFLDNEIYQNVQSKIASSHPCDMNLMTQLGPTVKRSKNEIIFCRINWIYGTWCITEFPNTTLIYKKMIHPLNYLTGFKDLTGFYYLNYDHSELTCKQFLSRHFLLHKQEIFKLMWVLLGKFSLQDWNGWIFRKKTSLEVIFQYAGYLHRFIIFS